MSSEGVTVFADTRKAIHGSGCTQVTIPQDLTDVLDIEVGDELLITYEQGDDAITLRRADQFDPYE